MDDGGDASDRWGDAADGDGATGGRPDGGTDPEWAVDRPLDDPDSGVSADADGPDRMASPRSRLRAAGVALGVAVAGFVLAVVLVQFAYLGLYLADVPLTVPVQLVAGLLVLQGVAFPLVAYAYVRRRGLGWSYVRARTPSRRDLAVVVGGYVGVFVLAAVATAVVTALLAGPPDVQRADQDALQIPRVAVLMIPLSILVIGPGEELLFRGIIQRRLGESFPAPVAILGAAALFAPAHVPALTGSPQGIAAAVGLLFVPSLVFGVTYEYTDNLVVPALIHGLYNATIFATILLGAG
jgi:membrane protease YdiL (CAAX protease family)